MFEHVGCRNYREFMEITRRLLESDGLFSVAHHRVKLPGKQGPILDQQIYFSQWHDPVGGKNVTRAFGKLYVMEDWQNFGAYYDKTLMAWGEKISKTATRAGAFKTTERARRMFSLLPASCAGAFRGARPAAMAAACAQPQGRPGRLLYQRSVEYLRQSIFFSVRGFADSSLPFKSRVCQAQKNAQQDSRHKNKGPWPEKA